MNDVYILCVDDEPEVLETVERDLAGLDDFFPVELAENAAQARLVLDKIERDGNVVGVILCDHVMPGESGVDLLVDLQSREKTRSIRKILLTGQAGLDATIKAVNEADLNHYVAKPWDGEKLLELTRLEMTEFFLHTNRNPLPHINGLDAVRVANAVRERGLITDR